MINFGLTLAAAEQKKKDAAAKKTDVTSTKVRKHYRTPMTHT
jgi:hypothetical protein